MDDDAVPRALDALRAGRPEAALAPLHERLVRVPDDPAALRLLSVAHLQRGALVEAEAAARSAAVVAPDSPEVLYQLGQALHARGDHDGARQAWEGVVARRPGFAPAWTNLGRIHDDAFRHEDALHCFDRALALGGDEPLVHTNRGNALMGLGRWLEAVGAYDAALRTDPGTWPAALGKTTALVELGQFEAARAVPVAGTPADRGDLEVHTLARPAGDLQLAWFAGRHPRPDLLRAEAEAVVAHVARALDGGHPVTVPVDVGFCALTLRPRGQGLDLLVPDLSRDPMRHRTALAEVLLQSRVMAGMLGARVRQPPSPVGWLHTVTLDPDALDADTVALARLPPVDPADSGWRLAAVPGAGHAPVRLPVAVLLQARPALTRALTLPTAWTARYEGDALVSACDASGVERLASVGPAAM